MMMRMIGDFVIRGLVLGELVLGFVLCLLPSGGDACVRGTWTLTRSPTHPTQQLRNSTLPRFRSRLNPSFLNRRNWRKSQTRRRLESSQWTLIDSCCLSDRCNFSHRS